jgi:predicted dienelactone hydrolase
MPLTSKPAPSGANRGPRLRLVILSVLAALALTASGFVSARSAHIGSARLELQRRSEGRQRPARERRGQTAPSETTRLAGLNVAIWTPPASGEAKRPLLVFSHGLNGCSTQSTFLTAVLAGAGYVVAAPDHEDAACGGSGSGRPSRPEESFAKSASWSDATYRDRRDDIARLIDALGQDPRWSARIDWARVGLVGHSLGGYTMLGLAGGWPSWKISGIKAVLALSPACDPLALKGALGSIGIPVMYQGGTADIGITPFVKRPNGCFAKNSSPAIFVEFQGAGHFAWTDVSGASHRLIERYSLAFLDKYVRGSTEADPGARTAGVSDLRVK